MSEAVAEKFEQSNPVLAQRIRHAIPEPGYMHNLTFLKMGDVGMKYLHSVLKYPETIQSFQLTENHLSDASAPLIVDIIRRAPNLEDLNIGKNHFTAEGFALIAEAVAEHPKITQFKSYNNLMIGAGEAIAELFRNAKALQHFSAKESGLIDADFQKIAPALAENKTLESVVFSGNHPSIEGGAAMAEAGMFSNRNLWQMHLESKYDAVNQAVVKTFMDAKASNTLLSVEPETEDTKRKELVNKEEMERGRKSLARTPEMTGADLRRVEGRYALVFAEKYVNKAAYEALIAELPTLPAEGEDFAVALFRKDDKGFAPLDNPRLWKDAASAKASLDKLSLDSEMLSRSTDKGSGILDAAAAAIPAKELVEYLNERGIKLGAKLLLGDDGKQTPLMETFVKNHQGGALLGVSNWLGKPVGEMREVYQAIPEYQRNSVGFQQMAQEMKSTQSSGLGR